MLELQHNACMTSLSSSSVNDTSSGSSSSLNKYNSIATASSRGILLTYILIPLSAVSDARSSTLLSII